MLEGFAPPRPDPRGETGKRRDSVYSATCLGPVTPYNSNYPNTFLNDLKYIYIYTWCPWEDLGSVLVEPGYYVWKRPLGQCIREWLNEADG
jgi:hypothetical protein